MRTQLFIIVLKLFIILILNKIRLEPTGNLFELIPYLLVGGGTGATKQNKRTELKERTVFVRTEEMIHPTSSKFF